MVLGGHTAMLVSVKMIVRTSSPTDMGEKTTLHPNFAPACQLGGPASTSLNVELLFEIMARSPGHELPSALVSMMVLTVDPMGTFPKSIFGGSVAGGATPFIANIAFTVCAGAISLSIVTNETGGAKGAGRMPTSTV